MGLITGLVTFPLAPVRGTVWIAEQVQAAAEQEYYDEGAIQEQLREVEAARQAGTTPYTYHPVPRPARPPALTSASRSPPDRRRQSRPPPRAA